MAKHKVFDLIYRQSKSKKLKSQFELNNMNENIDKIRKLETDLTYNIEETVEVGLPQSGHSLKLTVNYVKK